MKTKYKDGYCYCPIDLCEPFNFHGKYTCLRCRGNILSEISKKNNNKQKGGLKHDKRKKGIS